ACSTSRRIGRRPRRSSWNSQTRRWPRSGRERGYAPRMPGIDRRDLFRAGAVTLLASACHAKAAEEDVPYLPPPAWPPTQPTQVNQPVASLASLPSPEIVEVSIAELADKLAHGQTTSVALVRAYRTRIDAAHELAAVIEVNREAEAIAARLDAERAAGHVRGP